MTKKSVDTNLVLELMQKDREQAHERMDRIEKDLDDEIFVRKLASMLYCIGIAGVAFMWMTGLPPSNIYAVGGFFVVFLISLGCILFASAMWFHNRGEISHSGF